METKDHAGKTVRVGSRVRLLTLSDTLLDSLPDDARKEVLEMIGAEFEVEEVDQHGQAWVTKCWDRGNGEIDGHGIGLSSSEMLLIATTVAPK